MNGSVIKGWLKGIISTIEMIRAGLKRRKEVLLVAQNELMFSYCHLIYRLLRGDDRLRIYFVFPHIAYFSRSNILSLKKRYKIKTVPPKVASLCHWDLIIYPDHGWFMPYKRDLKKIYVGHGLIAGAASGTINGEIWSFDYRHTLRAGHEPFYDKIFVPSEYIRQIGIKQYPKLKDIIVATGSLMFDDFLKALSKKNKNPCQDSGQGKNVMIVSTWGKHSLIQRHGEALIEQIRLLHRKYNFIISLHPSNFLKDHSEGIDWKERMVELERLYGVRTIFSPLDWKSHLAKADLLIVDHSSMFMFFLAADRPILHQKINGAVLNEGSPVYLLMEKAYTIENFEDLGRKIEEADKNYKKGTFNELLANVVSHTGSADREYRRIIYSLLNLRVQR